MSNLGVDNLKKQLQQLQRATQYATLWSELL